MAPVHVEKLQLGGVEISLETGALARQASGAVVVRQGKTFLLATVMVAPGPASGVDFLPLTVDYRERMSAAGQIPQNYFRREARPSEPEILTCRLIDRSLRPLIPASFRSAIQVQVTVLGYEEGADLPVLAILGAAAAAHLSELPFEGPVAGIRAKNETLDLVLSCTRNGVVMAEGAAREASTDQVLDGLDGARAALAPALDALDRMRERAGRPRRSHEVPAIPPDLAEAIGRADLDPIDAALEIPDKLERRAALQAAQIEVVEEIGGDAPADAEPALARAAVATLVKRRMRERILAGRRIGGRGREEVRALRCEVGLLGGNHGSALFCRGETQALVSVTLGQPEDAQSVDSLDGRRHNAFILHYNFPSFSVGEVRPLRGPGRREIGHGNLARRALLPVLPEEGSFPFTIRIVSDILESNGSSSMATVCGASLALMDAGAPVSRAVAGIAMGLVAEGERLAILSDILGDEDHLGDMDFKVAGTSEGITAIQLDNKLGSLPREVLARAVAQARGGLDHILGRMAETLAEARADLPSGVPRVVGLRIRPEHIGRVIGQGGKTIKAIQAETDTRIKVSDDGSVSIRSRDPEAAQAARRRIEALVMDLQKGGLYVATVESVADFGAFVRIGDHQGLVHTSELSGALEEISAGTEIRVRALGADDRGRLQLSQRAAEGNPRSDALNA